MRFPRETRWLVLAGTLAAGATVGCDDSLQLLPANNANTVDTVTIYALSGTPVASPSGYDVPIRRAARTDVAAFDFAFDLDEADESVLYPAGALGLERASGILKATQEFDSLKTAPTTGYIDSLAVSVAPGTVFVVRSRPYLGGCELVGELPRYGKFRVLSVDLALRSLTLETLVNQNCGYRSLEPGVPTI